MKSNPHLYHTKHTNKAFMELSQYLLSSIYGYVSAQFIINLLIQYSIPSYTKKGYALFTNLFFWVDIKMLNICFFYR
jgi:hypothetical protein